jgi:hypothetical protein
MFKQRYIYDIPPMFEKPSMGHKWAFVVKLDSEAAVYAREKSLLEVDVDTFQEQGSKIIKDFSIYAINERMFRTPYTFLEDSFLLHYVNAPGDATDLEIGWEFMYLVNEKWGEESKNELLEFPLVYDTHNVETQVQASCLLSLWLHWANTLKTLME